MPSVTSTFVLSKVSLFNMGLFESLSLSQAVNNSIVAQRALVAIVVSKDLVYIVLIFKVTFIVDYTPINVGLKNTCTK